MYPLSLSRGLDVVVEVTRKGRKRPHWFDSPIGSLIAFLGDVPVRNVTVDDVIAWYDWLRTKENDRKPGRKLSAWTIDSYARSVKSYFNKLIITGHLDISPARRLRLPRLPAKGKKEISQADIALMVQHSELNIRDHAIVLLLRDSGCRVGELTSIQVEAVKIEESGSSLRGRAIIFDDKTMTSRFAYFGHDCALAIKKYIRVRPCNAPDVLFVSSMSGGALSRSGVYQMLKRIGKRSGVTSFNPHAFRHAKAKELINNGAPHKVIQDILGHSDITTTLNMYVNYDDDELADLHGQYTIHD